jgi:hypothetical protein
MKEGEKLHSQEQEQAPRPEAVNNESILLELLKRLTGVYNHVMQGKLLDANDIQRIDNIFLTLLVLNERNYFESAIRRKDLEKEKFESYLKLRHKFIIKQFEMMLADLQARLMESRDNKEKNNSNRE